MYFKHNQYKLTSHSARKLKKMERTYMRGELIVKSIHVYKDSANSDALVDTLCVKRLKTAIAGIGITSTKGIQSGVKLLDFKPKENYKKAKSKLEIGYSLFSELSRDSLIELQKVAIAQNNKIEESAVWNDTKNPNAKPKYNAPYLLSIKFVEGKSKIKKESIGEIDRLFNYLSGNSNLTILIRGHVCCGNNDRISKKRAKAVFKELRKRGIANNRMEYVGMSNRDPLVYPEKSNNDRQKNRRVDIKLMLLEVNAN